MKTTQSVFNQLQKVSYVVAPYVKDGQFILSDLRTTIIEKTNLPNGIYNMVAGEMFKTGELTDDLFVPELNDFKSVSKANAKDMSLIATMQKLCSKDELRPVMNGVCIEDNTIIATDANALRHEKIDIEGNFIFKHHKALLNEDCEIFESEKCLKFDYGDYAVIITKIEGKYPAWKSVIPTHKHPSSFKISKETLKSISDICKKSLLPIMVTESELIYDDINLGIRKTWPVTWTNHPQKYNGILMPMYTEAECLIAICPRYLVQLADANDITLSFEEKTRALLTLTEKPINKPTMKTKNQEVKTETKVETKKAQKTKPELEVTISIYSEKSFVVTGNTKEIKDQLKEAGGRWNKFLKNEQGTFSGWIFSNKKREQVESLIR